MSWSCCGARIIGAIRNLPVIPPIVLLQGRRAPRDTQWTTAHGYIAYDAKMTAQESGVAVAIRTDWAKRWSTRILECERHYVAVNLKFKDKELDLKIASIYIPPRGSRYYDQEWTEAAMTMLKETDSARGDEFGLHRRSLVAGEVRGRA